MRCWPSRCSCIPLLGGDWITTFTSVAIYSVVAAGLGILYGRVGMISLCQIALLAIGTWVAARFSYLSDLPFPVLLLLTGAITAAVGVLIGLPALRLTGLHLALITLMAAGAVTVILGQVNFPNGGGGFTGRGTGTANVDVPRPDWAISDTSFYRYTVVVCALMFALALLHVPAQRAVRGRRSARASPPRSPPASTSRSTSSGRSRSRRS